MTDPAVLLDEGVNLTPFVTKDKLALKSSVST